MSATGSRETISLKLISGLLVLVAMTGLLLIVTINNFYPFDPTRSSVFFLFTARYEIIFVGLLSISALLIPVCGKLSWEKINFPWKNRPGRWAWLLSLGVTGFCAMGTFLFYQRFPLCMDEFWMQLGAKGFAGGLAKIPLPENLHPYAEAVVAHMGLIGDAGSWQASNYLPTYAMILAVFYRLGLEWIFNPLCAGLTVWLSYWVAGLIWPKDRQAPLVAAVFTAFSCQYLIVGMSLYAMAAYPPLHLLWLGLYLKRYYWALPLLGIIIMGIHQPVVHALLIWPFLLRMMRRREWKAWSYLVLMYGLSSIFWFFWISHMQPETDFAQVPSRFFHFLPITLPYRILEVLHIFNWNMLLCAPLFLLALRLLRFFDDTMRDLAYGLGGVLLFYSFFLFTQGHGWGGRYFHPNLPAFIFLSVAAWRLLKEDIGKQVAWNLVFYAISVAVLIQLPARCWQVSDFITPYRKGAELIRSYQTDYVIADTRGIYYGVDLIRNDPYLVEKPIVFNKYYMDPEDIEVLRQRGTVAEVGFEELRELGLMEALPIPARMLDASEDDKPSMSK